MIDPSKLSIPLAERLRDALPGELLDVVIELERRLVEPTPGLSREERIAPVRDAFARDASPVRRAVLAAGGEVLGEAWINQTIRARVPPEGILALSALRQVVALDVPRRLRREGAG